MKLDFASYLFIKLHIVVKLDCYALYPLFIIILPINGRKHHSLIVNKMKMKQAYFIFLEFLQLFQLFMFYCHP